MTDSEFKALRPGDKVSVSGKQIAFDAVVTGPHDSNDEIPIQVVEVHYRAENLDYVYQAYRAGHRTTEGNRPALLHGWISEGVSRWG
ncbi:hypothetical protein [Candidatus Amarolinea aalborgensis]|jgi:hypothetical protein|uniref:hypothetical protein n=1 Tax=Candidatus Amarolinea aalborgensis TaxID=2249329 RepID=UPI003BF971A1